MLSQSIPCTSPSGLLRASLPEGKLRRVMSGGLTTAPTSAAGLGLHLTLSTSFTVSSRSRSPLATALWWPQRLTGRPDPRPSSLRGLSTWSWCASEAGAAVPGQVSHCWLRVYQHTPERQCISAHTSPYPHYVTAALPPPDNRSQINDHSSGLWPLDTRSPKCPGHRCSTAFNGILAVPPEKVCPLWR